MDALAGFVKALAFSIERERVLTHVEFKEVAGHLLYLLQARIAKFKNVLAILADEVVVLPVHIGFLVHGLVLTELMLGDQFAVEQHINGIVKRGATHLVLLAFHVVIQGLDIEVAINAVNFLQNGESLGCFTQVLFFEVIGKDLFYLLLDIVVGHSVLPAKVAQMHRSIVIKVLKLKA